MRKQQKQETNESLRRDYVSHAAYYYYRGFTTDENMLSAFERNLAEKLKEALITRCMPVPEGEEIRAYATSLFPPDHLHEP